MDVYSLVETDVEKNSFGSQLVGAALLLVTLEFSHPSISMKPMTNHMSVVG